MAADPALASAEQEDTHPDVLVSRQAVGVARAYLEALRWAEGVLEHAG
jgi:hypothetical protein